MVIDGETGFIVRQNDAYALAEKITYLKNNPVTLKYMSDNARLDFRERFSADIMAKEYERFYISLIK